MNISRKAVAAVLIAFALGWWLGRPQPWSPERDRPGLTWIMRAAKRLLWIAIVADPPPADTEPASRQTVVGDDGFRVVEHRRGW